MQGALAAAIETLFEVDQTRLSSAELLDQLSEIETARRRLEALTNLQVAEIEQRGLAHEHACVSTADLISQLLLVSPAEAKLRVARAKDLGPRRDFQGGPLEPIFPLVAAAQAQGTLSPGHVTAIIKTIDAIPAHVKPDVVDSAEVFLVEKARLFDPGTLAKIGQKLLATVDPDGAEPREDEYQRRRQLTITRRSDGTFALRGQLTPECAATWTPILDTLATPIPSVDGIRDDRSASQRRHDGLLDAGQRLLRSGSLPDSGGVPATIVLTMTEPQLRTGVGTAQTEHDDPIDLSTALRLAEQAEVVAVRFDEHGGIANFGTTRRLASAGQRRALVARDHGCTFPGCTRPASWCQANHARPWYLGGKTDLNNLHLLCGFHHREFEKRGWTVHIKHGVVEWIPPAWLDPERRPIRNTAHHLPDFDFR